MRNVQPTFRCTSGSQCHHQLVISWALAWLKISMRHPGRRMHVSELTDDALREVHSSIERTNMNEKKAFKGWWEMASVFEESQFVLKFVGSIDKNRKNLETYHIIL